MQAGLDLEAAARTSICYRLPAVVLLQATATATARAWHAALRSRVTRRAVVRPHLAAVAVVHAHGRHASHAAGAAAARAAAVTVTAAVLLRLERHLQPLVAHLVAVQGVDGGVRGRGAVVAHEAEAAAAAGLALHHDARRDDVACTQAGLRGSCEGVQPAEEPAASSVMSRSARMATSRTVRCENIKQLASSHVVRDMEDKLQ